MLHRTLEYEAIHREKTMKMCTPLRKSPAVDKSRFPSDAGCCSSTTCYYRIGAGLFSLVGMIGIGLAASRHETEPGRLRRPVPRLSSACSADPDAGSGDETSDPFLGARTPTWEQVRRLDQGRAYSIHGEGTSRAGLAVPRHHRRPAGQSPRRPSAGAACGPRMGEDGIPGAPAVGTQDETARDERKSRS